MNSCLIVGAGPGLGVALAKKFATEGYNIGLISREEKNSKQALEAAVDCNRNGKHGFFKADAREPEKLSEIIEDASTNLGDFSVAIFNARGKFVAKSPLDVSFNELEDIFNLEVIGAFAMAKAVIPKMIDNKSGTVIFSSATAAYRGSAENPLYSIGKFGLRALSQSLAKAYAKQMIHVAHVRLDCDLNTPFVKEWYGSSFNSDETANVDDVADNYFMIHKQPRSAWSNEIELRPYTEAWSF